MSIKESTYSIIPSNYCVSTCISPFLTTMINMLVHRDPKTTQQTIQSHEVIGSADGTSQLLTHITPYALGSVPQDYYCKDSEFGFSKLTVEEEGMGNKWMLTRLCC